MKNKKNIFDLSKINDLPSEIIDDFTRSKNIITIADRIIELFSIKDTLTTNEIIAALYRKYGMSKKKSNISQRLYKLSLSGKIKKIGICKYKLNECKK